MDKIKYLENQITHLKKIKDELYDEFLKNTNYIQIRCQIATLQRELEEIKNHCNHDNLELVEYEVHDSWFSRKYSVNGLRCKDCGYETHQAAAVGYKGAPKNKELFESLMKKYKEKERIELIKKKKKEIEKLEAGMFD